MLELFPVIFDYLKQVGGPEMSEKTFANFRRQNNLSWHDMSTILTKAHELVDDGLLSSDDFADFVFRNPARLFASMDPEFFVGTAVAA